MVQVQHFLVDFSVQICPLLKVGIPTSSIVFFSLQICWYLLKIELLQCWVHIYLHILLMNWFLSHYIMATLISCYSFWVKSILSESKYSYPCFLCFHLHGIFFHFIPLRVFLSLNWRDFIVGCIYLDLQFCFIHSSHSLPLYWRT